MQVRPEGSRDAKYCLIGEAPGEIEARYNRPFIGAAGHKLDDILRRVGIPRSECYITNVVKERPPKNDITKFVTIGKTGVTTTPEYDNYVDILYQELGTINPRVIVPLGNVALHALTGKIGISNWRNSPLVYTNLSGADIPCIPTLHPSSALYTPINEYIIASDFCRIKRVGDGMVIPVYDDHFLLRPSYADTMSYLSSIQHGAAVAYDIEVLNNEVSCISFARTSTDCICIPFMGESGDYFDPDQELDIWLEIARILEDRSINKIGQNLSFDCTFLFRKYGIDTGPCDDTMVAAGILYPDLPKGLDFLTSTGTYRPYYKGEGKKWKSVGATYESFWRYNALDSAVCMEIIPQQIEELKRQGNLETYRRQVSLMSVAVYMQARGILMDIDSKKKASAALAVEMEELTKELVKEVGHPINPKSPKQLINYFYVELGITPYLKNKKMTTDVNALKRLARRGFKAAQILQKTRRIGTLRSRYFEMAIDPDNRMRCAINLVGTTTGRFSTSKSIMGTGGNMQNLPRASEFKRFMQCDPGHLMIDMDLSQAENRIVAYIAPEPRMIDAFEKGVDVHSLTAAAILHKKVEEISRKPGSCELGTGEDSERDWGKKGNHGINYGLSFKAFALNYDMPEKEAKDILNLVHSGYPGIRGSYHIWVRALLEKRTLTNCYGRKRKFIVADPEQGYAFIPQSTVADKINKDGLLHVWNNQDIFGPIDMLIQVHDNILMQADISAGWNKIAYALLSLRKSLESPVTWHGREFVIPAEAKVGLNGKDLQDVKLPYDLDEAAEVLKQKYEEIISE